MATNKQMLDETLKVIIPATGLGLAALIVDQFTKSAKRSRDAIESNDSSTMDIEIARKRAETQILLLEAKVSQEAAIAKRIEEADVVEIEEYYEKSSKEGLGVTLKDECISAGFSAEGQKITKRVYRFTNK